jgi:hypothetical protein
VTGGDTSGFPDNGTRCRVESGAALLYRACHNDSGLSFAALQSDVCCRKKYLFYECIAFGKEYAEIYQTRAIQIIGFIQRRTGYGLTESK